MNSTQYEELCRSFLSKRVGVPLEEIRSIRIPNARRPGLPEYQHQIDLYWETGDGLAQYLNIANAKWRGNDPIDQPDVLLLQQVKQKVAAHKAFIITSVGFTAGAKAAAIDEGIALHILRPSFDEAQLPAKDRSAILAAIEQIADVASNPIYTHEVVHRAFDFTGSPPKQPAGPSQPITGHRAATGYTTRAVADRSGGTGGQFNRSSGRGGGNLGTGGGRPRGAGSGGAGIIKK